MGFFSFFRRFFGALSRTGNDPPVRCAPTGKGSKRLIAYLTEGSKGWILDFLWRDITSCSVWRDMDAPELHVASDLETLASLMDQSDAIVLVMFQGHLPHLLRFGIPPERVILYLTHVRIGLGLPDLNLLHGVLTLNSYSKSLLRIHGVHPNRIHYFPAGYDPNFFYSGPPLAQRCFDVVFVGRYMHSSHSNYHNRKRYQLLCQLIGLLCSCGNRVALLGSGWQNCEYVLPAELERFDVPHSKYGAIYRQSSLVCSVSSQEGGPVSFLEGLASGCLMLSVSTGFAADFQCGVDGVWHLPITALVHGWYEQIQHCLRLGHSDSQLASGRCSSTKTSYLHHAQFEQLAMKLRQLSVDPVVESTIERSDG